MPFPDIPDSKFIGIEVINFDAGYDDSVDIMYDLCVIPHDACITMVPMLSGLMMQ